MDQQQPQPLMQTDEGQQAWTLHRLYPATKRAAEIRQGIWTALLQGIPNLSRFLKSVRVGSGSATFAAFDGGDGRVMADGTLAAFLSRDRADSTKGLILWKNGTIRLSSLAVDLWLISDTTGLITQAALGSITAGTNVTLNPANTPTSGTQQWLPTGHVTVYFSMTAGAAIGAGATLGTIATTAHRPSGTVPLVLRDGAAGGTLSAYVLSSGVIACDAGLTNAHIYHGVTTY